VVFPLLLRISFFLVRPLATGFAELLSDPAEQEIVKSLRGLALKIQRNSDQRVPVEYGNLRGSSYVEQNLKPGSGGSWEVGYTASYATYVHENLEMKWRGKPRRSGIGEYWGPHGESKFLEKAFNEEVDKLHMADNMKRFFKGGGIKTSLGS
jgi:hypothetical protein